MIVVHVDVLVLRKAGFAIRCFVCNSGEQYDPNHLCEHIPEDAHTLEGYKDYVEDCDHLPTTLGRPGRNYTLCRKFIQDGEWRNLFSCFFFHDVVVDCIAEFYRTRTLLLHFYLSHPLKMRITGLLWKVPSTITRLIVSSVLCFSFISFGFKFRCAADQRHVPFAKPKPVWIKPCEPVSRRFTEWNQDGGIE